MGNYQRFKPLPTAGIETRKAWIVSVALTKNVAGFLLAFGA